MKVAIPILIIPVHRMTINAGNDLALARLMQLISPSLPIGGYSYSQGIEWAVEASWIRTADDLYEWLEGLLKTNMRHLELPLLKRMLIAWSAHDMDSLCKTMRERYQIAVVTNDIYTREDAEFLVRSGALDADRIVGVETGGCPHTAIREDASMNLAAVQDLSERFNNLDIIFIESGGDNLSATFSPELADLMIYVIDVAEGEKFLAKADLALPDLICW